MATQRMPASPYFLAMSGNVSGCRRRKSTPSPAASIERVDDAEEQVAADVLEVAAVLEPLAGGRDVVGRALALGLHQDRQVEVVVAVPRRRTAAAAADARWSGDDLDDDAEPSAGGAMNVFSPGS